MEQATVLALYRPRPGQEAELHRLVLLHVPLLRRLGLLADAPTALLRTAAGTFIEIFRWKSAEQIRQAGSNPEVLQLWRDIGRVSDSPTVDEGVGPATELPSFIPVSMASRLPDATAMRAKLSGAARVIAALSLIPFVGLPLALLSILWGLTTKRPGGSRLLASASAVSEFRSLPCSSSCS